MGKKYGFNIMLFVFIIILFAIFSCNQKPNSNIKGILMKTDHDFSEMSVNEGMFKAFLFYIDDKGIILRDNSFPSEGKDALIKYYSGKSDTSFILSWEPVFENISDSGELGYTYGIWTNREKDSGEISRGTYITIWKKQRDDSWKFILDTGTSGLPQEN